MTENERLTRVLAIVTGAIILTLLTVSIVSTLTEFNKEMRYLNREIKRTRGSEQKHYLKQRRRLWLSLIPFVKY